MTLDNDTVRHIAKLARLTLTDEEVTRYATDLGVVFSYIDQLNDVESLNADTPITTQVTGLMNVVRDDVEVERTEDEKEAMKQAFPDRVGDLLKVQAVFTDTDNDA